MGEELISELQRKGGDALPPIKRSWGERMNHYLRREVPTWVELLNESAATNKRWVTPYGFRHGYAWRGSQLYGLTPRVLASLMGHTVAIHLKHYGQWASETETAEAVRRAIELAKTKGIESTDRGV
jgi:integrase